jgi:hypothetical protein
MKTLKLASIGSISHGTLRLEDLLPAYISHAEHLQLTNGDYLASPENFALRDALTKLVGEAQDCFSDDGETLHPDGEEIANYLVCEDFPNMFDQFAPPYCYFGTHEGDGSDFGYWPSMEQIEELPKISDNSEETVTAELFNHSGSDICYVNDHGNVTVYGGDGSVLLELV